MRPSYVWLKTFFKAPRSRGVAITMALFTLGMFFTALAEQNGWDLAWSGSFFTPGGSHGGWSHAREQPWGFLYDYGEIPGVFMLIAALGGYLAARAGKIRKLYERRCMIVILTIALGPGVVANGILKNCWGRPRPADISIFGGDSEYRKVSEPGIPGGGKSLPCGHASMAFVLASGVAFYPLHTTLAIASLVGGIAYGFLVGTARLAQGGHFPTDVVWAGILDLMILSVLYFIVYRIPETEEKLTKPLDGAG
jgi:lipid A 4'-phosphatase